jgi:hypothetical protein
MLFLFRKKNHYFGVTKEPPKRHRDLDVSEEMRNTKLPSSIDNLLVNTEQYFPMASDFPGKFTILILLFFALMSQKELFATLSHRRL